MGTYTSTSNLGADVNSAYRKLEIAYHDLQSAQVHLRSVHARSMHGRSRSQELLRQELLRLNDRIERTALAYRDAMDEYVRASTSVSEDGRADPTQPRPASSGSNPRFPTAFSS